MVEGLAWDERFRDLYFTSSETSTVQRVRLPFKIGLFAFSESPSFWLSLKIFKFRKSELFLFSLQKRQSKMKAILKKANKPILNGRRTR